MMDENDPLLELILLEQLSLEQKELLPLQYASASDVPVFQFLRTPTCWDDFDIQTNCEMFILLQIETIIYITGNKTSQRSPPGNVNFSITSWRDSLKCSIYGTTDAAIAQSVTWFWWLQFKYKRSTVTLLDDPHQLPFDFASLTAKQLKTILSTERKFVLERGTWTAEQSIILATRSHRMHLELTGTFAFEDSGTAFVDAMETRTSRCGVLHFVMDEDNPLFRPDNLERLARLEPAIFTRLGGSAAERPFEVFGALEYHVKTRGMELDDFRAFDFSSDSLAITMYLDETECWALHLVEFLTGVAEFGHLERFLFYMDYKNEDNGEQCEFNHVAIVMGALIYAIDNNPNLAVLDLSGSHDRFDWVPHLPRLFEALQEHQSLEYIMVKSYPLHQPYLGWMFGFLMRNRKITVVDESHQVCWNHSTMKKDIIMNPLRDQFAGLKTESSAIQASLVGMFLTRFCSNSFHVVPLFMSLHTDVVCGLIEHVIVEKMTLCPRYELK